MVHEVDLRDASSTALLQVEPTARHRLHFLTASRAIGRFFAHSGSPSGNLFSLQSGTTRLSFAGHGPHRGPIGTGIERAVMQYIMPVTVSFGVPRTPCASPSSQRLMLAPRRMHDRPACRRIPNQLVVLPPDLSEVLGSFGLGAPLVSS